MSLNPLSCPALQFQTNVKDFSRFSGAAGILTFAWTL